MADACCSTCRFWHEFRGPRPASETAVGACRRYPPIVLSDDESHQYTTAPITGADGWCGEHATFHS